jgi:hypothetical protein
MYLSTVCVTSRVLPTMRFVDNKRGTRLHAMPGQARPGQMSRLSLALRSWLFVSAGFVCMPHCFHATLWPQAFACSFGSFSATDQFRSPHILEHAGVHSYILVRVLVGMFQLTYCAERYLISMKDFLISISCFILAHVLSCPCFIAALSILQNNPPE